MPEFTKPIPEIRESIIRPVTSAIVEDIMRVTGIDPKKTYVQIRSGYGTIQTPGSDYKEQLTDKMSTDDRIDIEISESYDPAGATTTPVLYPEHLVIFKDRDLRITMKPVYHTVNVTLNFKYYSKDRFTASNWLREVRNRAVRDANNPRLFSADYHYPIPTTLMVVLLKLHQLRENVQGYGDDLGTWFKKCFTPKMTPIVNNAGKGTTFVIREKQIGIQGMFDFSDQPPSAETEDKGGPYLTSFSYTFQYDRPESVAIRYPLMVHNQMVDESLRLERKPTDLDTIAQENSLSYDLFTKFGFASQGAIPYSAAPGFPIPHFDEWLQSPSTFKPGTENILRVMLQVDPVNPRDILSLTQLGNWELKPAVIAYMRKNPQALLIPYQSLFHIELHAWDSLTAGSNLIISPDLDIRANFDLNRRTNYHLVIQMVTDLSRLPPEVLNEIGTDIDLVTSVIKVISKKPPILIRPDGSTKTPLEVLKDWIKRPNVFPDNSGTNVNPGTGNETSVLRTNQFGAIVAHRS